MTDTSPLPITAVIITHNEAENIGRCLAPLVGLVAEILVIDGHSTDGTAAIAEGLGATVLAKDWAGYSGTKNWGNAQARHDWILSIDADEVVSEELAASLRTAARVSERAYALDRLTNYCGTWVHHSGWYPDWKVRLFDRRRARWTGDYVHERLELDAGTQVERLTGKLYHYSYKSRADHRARIERYTTLAAQELYAKGKTVPFWKPLLSPAARFVRTYVFKQGWRDGAVGLHISRENARLVGLKYRKLRGLRTIESH